MIVLYQRLLQPPDAIAEYTRHLARALREHGCLAAAASFLPCSTGSGARDLALAPAKRAILWQYNPFSYGWKGLAPWASTFPLRARIQQNARVCVTFHELYFPFGRQGVKGAVWAIAQRLQCAAIGATTSAMIATTGPRAAALRRWFPWRERFIWRIPVGSNVPVVSIDEPTRRLVREKLGAVPDTLLVGIFGSLDGGLQANAAIQALSLLRRRGIPARLAFLGRAAGSPRRAAELLAVARAAGVDAHLALPGSAAAETISRQLSALDLFLAPYDDGVSGRRTGLMAALAHGLPVVGTRSHNTDEDWFQPDEAVHFARSSSPEAIADALARVACDAPFRERLAHGARQLFRREFSWDAIAARYLDLMRDISGTPSRSAATAMRGATF